MSGSGKRERREDLEALRLRLEEAEQALEAIRTGEVDSLVVDGPDGPRIFTLEGATHSYRVLVEAMNEGAVTLTEGGTVLYCNARFAEMIATPLQRVIGSAVQDHVPERARATVDRLLERARRSGARDEVPLVTAGGEEFPAYLSVSSIVDEGRRVFCVVATDLREQRRTEAISAAEQIARESEERLRLALSYATAATWEWDLRSGAVRWSPEMYPLYGVEPTGRDLAFEDWKRTVHPEDAEAAAAAAIACIEGHTAEYSAEFRVADPRLRDRWLLALGRVERAPDGTPLRMLGLNVDITPRKRAEEELAVVSRLYAVLSRVNEVIVRTRDEQPLLEAVCRIVAEDGGFPLVWVGRVDGRAITPVASSGPAMEYLRGIRVETDGELGQGPTGVCVREDRPVINDDFGVNPATWPWREATLRHGLRASAAFPIRRDGAVIAALTFYASRPGAFTAAQVKLLEALCADVSYALGAIRHERLRTEAERALRESERDLREADRRKDEFLGMLSHELRNPLAPIRNATYILRHVESGSAQARRAQDVIERQTDHLTRLVDDLLDVTRVARGKIELRRARVDVRETVRRMAEDLRPLIEGRGVTLHVSAPDSPVWADADATRLAQAVGNLLHNAAKFTRRGDTVTLSVDADGSSARIRVRDTGTGIDADLLPRMFDAFVQGDRTLARTEGGLGLGLALVKAIAELHGGTVTAESAGAGQGSEFTIRLPLAAPSVAGDRTRAAPAGPPSGSRVLVVDDNVDAAESLAEALRIAGHDVDVAFDGAAAVEKARLDPPDVVVCDIGLPGMNGYEVARRIRALGNGAVQLVALSGYAQPEDVKRSVEAGFDGHLAKPCSPDQIEQLLGRARAGRAGPGSRGSGA